MASTNDTPRLRGHLLAAPLHVVLVEPEIPGNTGNIARRCGAPGSVLHLIEPLGFRTDEHAVRRAGLDYWHLVDVRQHKSFDAFLEAMPDLVLHLFATTAERSHLDVAYTEGNALVFGKESVGLSDELMTRFSSRLVGIPMPGRVRSLNLSNSVSIGLYEALRQLGALSAPKLG